MTDGKVNGAAKPTMRTASRNLVSVGLGAFSFRAAMLLLLAIYANALGAAGLGELEQLLALSLLLAPLVSLQVGEAFLPSYSRDAASGASTGAALITLACALVVVVGWIAWRATGSISALALSAHVASTIAWQFLRNMLRVIGRFDLVVRSELVLSVVGLVVGALLLLDGRTGFAGMLIAIAMGNCAAMIYARWMGLALFPSARVSRATMNAVKSIFMVASRLVPNVVMGWGIAMSDRLILALFASDAAVGIYAAGARIAGILMVVTLLLYQVWQPHAIRTLQNKEDARDFLASTFHLYLVGVSVSASVLLVCSGAILNLLFGPGFDAASAYLAILVPANMLVALAYFLGVGFYSASSTGAIRGTVLGCVASVALNFMLIPRFGATAAALSSVAAYLLMCAARYRDVRSNFGFVLPWRVMFPPAAIISCQSLLIYFDQGSLAMQLALCALLVVWAAPHLMRVAHSVVGRGGVNP